MVAGDAVGICEVRNTYVKIVVKKPEEMTQTRCRRED
jgi:hypothetical protein